MRNCTYCGLPLDAFGICPQADPKETVRQSSPVYCGKGRILTITINPSEVLALRIDEEIRHDRCA